MNFKIIEKKEKRENRKNKGQKYKILSLKELVRKKNY